mmetsp:Transcript_17000/g.20894  ORF Transcript_17000/g.20894 Transcript_17000/m.20894 type:complete len:307 (-) Transcript_17000:78-998(-)
MKPGGAGAIAADQSSELLRPKPCNSPALQSLASPPSSFCSRLPPRCPAHKAIASSLPSTAPTAGAASTTFQRPLPLSDLFSKAMSTPNHPECTSTATKQRPRPQGRDASPAHTVVHHHLRHCGAEDATWVGRMRFPIRQEIGVQATGHPQPTRLVHQEPFAPAACPCSLRTVQRNALANDHLWVAREDPSVVSGAAEEHKGAQYLDHPGQVAAEFAATRSTLSFRWMKLAQKVLARQEHPVAAKADHKDVQAVPDQEMFQCVAGRLPLFARAFHESHAIGLGACHLQSPLGWTQVTACEIAVLAAK